MPFFQEASGTNANDGVFNDVQGDQTNNVTHNNTNNTDSGNTTITENTDSGNNSSTSQTITNGSGGIVLGKREGPVGFEQLAQLEAASSDCFEGIAVGKQGMPVGSEQLPQLEDASSTMNICQ